MLRNKNLISLSHQHQRALALCVRIDRASPIADADLDSWQSEIAQHFRNEIGIHFAAEELVLFPAARRFEEFAPLIDELLADHVWLRDRFTAAEDRSMHAENLTAFAQRLSSHIRKEERQLFEGLQKLMSEEELAGLGRQLEEALKAAEQACIVPTAATRLRSAK
jgi:hemerythrin-like domain-containing protein